MLTDRKNVRISGRTYVLDGHALTTWRRQRPDLASPGRISKPTRKIQFGKSAGDPLLQIGGMGLHGDN